jgi:hypothetical protein
MARDSRLRPDPWNVHKGSVKHGWLLSFHAIEWVWQWTSYGLSRWAFVEVLEYLGRFSVLIAVIFYFAGAGDRQKQKHYQAWQVINTAQGKGGSGGRIEALQELCHDHVPLVGVDVSGAFLQGVRLQGADLLRCNLQAADVRMGQLSGTRLEWANLRSANFRDADLHDADLKNADLTDADIVGADLSGADLDGTDFSDADLRNANVKAIKWLGIRDIQKANVFGVRNAPEGFVAWALAHGAISEHGSD